MIGSVSTIFHLGAALRRAAGRVFASFFLTGIIIAAVVEAIGFFVANQTFNPITHVVAAVMGVGWAVAVSLLVLVGEIIRGLVTGVKDVAKDVEKEAQDAGGLVGGVINSVEGRNQPKK
jgi:hypothetical protein